MSTNIQANLTLNTAQAQASFNSFAASIGSAKFAQPLGRISGDAAEFTKSLSAATARVTAFGLTAGAIYKVSQAIREGAKATIEVDKQLIELNTYIGKSRDELEAFSQSLFKVAKNSAVPFAAAAEATGSRRRGARCARRAATTSPTPSRSFTWAMKSRGRRGIRTIRRIQEIRRAP